MAAPVLSPLPAKASAAAAPRVAIVVEPAGAPRPSSLASVDVSHGGTASRSPTASEDARCRSARVNGPRSFRSRMRPSRTCCTFSLGDGDGPPLAQKHVGTRSRGGYGSSSLVGTSADTPVGTPVDTVHRKVVRQLAGTRSGCRGWTAVGPLASATAMYDVTAWEWRPGTPVEAPVELRRHKYRPAIRTRRHRRRAGAREGRCGPARHRRGRHVRPQHRRPAAPNTALAQGWRRWPKAVCRPAPRAPSVPPVSPPRIGWSRARAACPCRTRSLADVERRTHELIAGRHWAPR